MVLFIRGEDMTNWQIAFKRWLKENRNLSDKSLGHYAGAIKNILSWVDVDILDITDSQSFDGFKESALKDSTFISRDSIGNNMYSVALNHFGGFIAAEISEESIIYPEVLKSMNLIEGAKKQITINAYERNPAARKACIMHYGAVCLVCGFNFQKAYGDDFEGIIHVHHIKPLNEITQEYVIDPIMDMVPVCPNCHLVIHSKPSGIYTIDEVKSFLNAKLSLS